MGHLPARQSANCLRQTAYLMLAEMSRAPINPWAAASAMIGKKAALAELRRAGAAMSRIYSR
jgi:hypothetical protein